MALRPFELHRPENLSEALLLLHENGDAASAMAGGTELLIALKARVLEYDDIVDLKRVAEMRGVSLAPDGTVSIGALCTHHELACHPVIREHLPAYATLSNHIANIRVRVAGTLGGNLCFAEPHADPPALLCALDAQLELVSLQGSRIVPMREFILGDFTTAREEGEILTKIMIPPRPEGSTFAFESFGHLERPAVGVAVGCIPHAPRMEYRIWVGAICGQPTRLQKVEEVLATAPQDQLLAMARTAAERAAANLEASDDIHGGADYKRHLVGVFVERMLKRALADQRKTP